MFKILHISELTTGMPSGDYYFDFTNEKTEAQRSF